MEIKQKLLERFIMESNSIEDINREPNRIEIQAHETLLSLDEVTVSDVNAFVMAIAGTELRDSPGMNVMIGGRSPISGGKRVVTGLRSYLNCLNWDLGSPDLLHNTYEMLHPYMDGNGRSGRALWAWQMLEFNHCFGLNFGFLRAYYYQTLRSHDMGA